MIHVGVDLHQRFCYMTAVNASGRPIQTGAVTNERAALRKYFRQFRGKATRGGITRQGSSTLRWILVEAAQTATRSSPAARCYYERLLRKKHKHVARVALARKLLIAVYALLHDGVAFDEEKFAAR